MKTLLNLRVILALSIVAASPAAWSAPLFTDNFSNGSTLDQTSTPGGTAAASYTSYDLASSKNATTSTIGANLLSLKLSSGTSSGYWEAQALFTNSAVALTSPGDYIDLAIVFTNSQNTLLTGSASPIWIGLFNSGAAPNTLNPPVAGALANAGLSTAAGSAYATGNCELWSGYVGQVYSNVASRIITRPVQNSSGTTSANQDLLGNGVSSGTFNNPTATVLATGAAQNFTLLPSGAYTLYLNITLDPAGSGNYIISNAVFQGAGTGGTMLYTNTASTSTILAAAFDGFAFGAFNHNGTLNPQMDVSEILITGQSTAPHAPPTITSEPVSVSVATGGSGAFFVSATGENVTYQWSRNGTNLVNGGNISGAQSSTLVISPAGAGDAWSGANGYYVTVSGAGDFSTNSTTNSLTLISPTSLIWTGANGSTWDVAASMNWENSAGVPEVFNYGDPVTFSDVGGGGQINLAGPYLSAASVTVDSSLTYTFEGAGSYAGPGSLSYIGSGQFSLDNVNTYSGGTLISNASAYLYLEVYGGLGTGPVTFGEAGGEMEIVPAGGSSTGINGDINVADDFNIQVDPAGTYGAVFLGNLSGTPGKTLTFTPGPTNTSTSRIRVYGGNTVYDANLDLNGSQFIYASYQDNGSQVYNGVISGSGAFMQKASSTTILNGQNIYTGGTYIPAGSLGLGCSTIGNIASGPIGTGPLYLAPDSTTTTTGNGQVFASGGPQIIANPIQYPTGTNNLTLIVGGSNNLTFTGPVSLNGNDSVVTNTIKSRIIEVTNTGLTTFSGAISDSGLGYGLTLTGAGILALENTETYTGPTAISNGTLQVDGQLAAASAVTVSSNGVLSGTGTVAGAVTILAGGGLAPGDQAIGTLTVNNGISLQPGSMSSFEVNASTGAHGLVTANSVALGGILSVTNLAGTPTTGATYTLFSAGSMSGNFSSITGSPGAGLAWSFNPANGVLSVVTGVNTTSTNLTYSLAGTNLTLSWPADHTGWALQFTTNLALSNWVTVAGSTTTNSVVIPISPLTNSVFYRMIYP